MRPTMLRIPGPVCFLWKFSSANGRPPYILVSPVPSLCKQSDEGELDKNLSYTLKKIQERRDFMPCYDPVLMWDS